jgi:hypothetical protein
MRSAVGQASNAYNNATNTAAGLGADANAISSTTTPFLTQEMLHPQGIGQAGLSAETAAAMGGAGGADAGIVGQAAQRAAASRNAGGFQAALDDASRNRTKAAAGASEGIQAQDENLKQQQQQEGAAGLEKMDQIDTSGMLQSQGQEAGDINSEVNANNSGWLQNATGIMSALGQGAMGAGMMGLKFPGAGGGGGGGCWVAAEIFGGWHEPRTVAVRQWLNTEFRKSLLGDLVMRFYLKFGERIAAKVRKYSILRRVLTPLFEAALRKANGE